jgi:putative transposase
MPLSDTSISGWRVVRELVDLIAERGAPKMVVSDSGTELTSNAVRAWPGDASVEWHYIAPRSILAGWADDDNTERPHSSLGYATPAAFVASPALMRDSTSRSLATAG